jgi:hypothetical protein
MQQIEQGNYTRQQIIDMLHGPRVEMKFRYDLLNKSDQKLGELDGVQEAEVSMTAFADIKRTAKIKMKDNTDIDWLSDRIQPFVLFRMPDKNWIEYPTGIFLLSSPQRKEESGNVYRDVECYDGLQVLLDDKVESRYTIAQGTLYTLAINNILAGAGISKGQITPSTAVLVTDREWEIGTPKLNIINELLQEINYTSLWCDEWGYYVATPYVLPIDRQIEYEYEDDELSVLYPGIAEELDLFNVPNKWVVTQSNAETEPLVSIYTNNNPDSPTSTVNRGRTIVDFRTVDNIADQTALYDYTRRIAYDASQVFGYIEFETAIMPFHSYMDMLQIRYSKLGIDNRYVETIWSYPLRIDGRMTHRARRVVQI